MGYCLSVRGADREHVRRVDESGRPVLAIPTLWRSCTRRRSRAILESRISRGVLRLASTMTAGRLSWRSAFAWRGPVYVIVRAVGAALSVRMERGEAERARGKGISLHGISPHNNRRMGSRATSISSAGSLLAFAIVGTCSGDGPFKWCSRRSASTSWGTTPRGMRIVGYRYLKSVLLAGLGGSRHRPVRLTRRRFKKMLCTSGPVAGSSSA
jgi:hypothetical protein